MVIHEALRLYPPVPVISREAFKDMKFGNIKVPREVNIWTMVLPLHTDPEIWGSDSYKFNPERFAKKIDNQKVGFIHHTLTFSMYNSGARIFL